MTEESGADAPRRRPGRRAASRIARLSRRGPDADGREGGAAAGDGGAGIRLNKLLASRGIGARRKCDALIQAGSVRVNGTIVKEPGVRVIPDRDKVEVHGRPIPGRAALRYVMVHKPVGVITTLDDPEGRPTMRGLLPPGPRLFPVGRLDAETSGLILATNDGELAHHLMHPRYGVRKLYRARLDRPPDGEQIRRLRQGVEFEPRVVSAPCDVRVRNARPERAEIEIALHEGRYRQVRRMCEAVGLGVVRLHRPAYGPLRLGTLPRGGWRELTAEEVRRLKAASARPVARAPRKNLAVPREAADAGSPRRAGRPRILRDRPLARASSAIHGSRSPSTLRRGDPTPAASLGGRRRAFNPRGGSAVSGSRSPSTLRRDAPSPAASLGGRRRSFNPRGGSAVPGSRSGSTPPGRSRSFERRGTPASSGSPRRSFTSSRGSSGPAPRSPSASRGRSAGPRVPRTGQRAGVGGPSAPRRPRGPGRPSGGTIRGGRRSARRGPGGRPSTY